MFRTYYFLDTLYVMFVWLCFFRPEEEIPNHILPRNTNRKISLVGHGYRPDMLKQDYHSEVRNGFAQ